VRRFLAALVFLFLGLGPGIVSAHGAGRDLSVLVPRDGFRSPGSHAWVVVRAGTAPRVTLDGGPLAGPTQAEEGVYHLRVGPLRPAGSRLEVEAAGKRAVLTLYGAAGAGAMRFHAAPAKSCSSCHEAGPKGCGECHRWPGALHAPAQQRQCGSCHDPLRPQPAEVASLCRPCHPKYTGAGRHPGLRHPVSAPQDPARPGRRFDCTSCHDPHAPLSLGRLTVEQRQRWCKGCHRR
jgi:predicted CXXCH cytochrome family protein